MAERCRGWDGDAARHGTVPLGLYAQAVHGVCGFVLSEDELCQLKTLEASYYKVEIVKIKKAQDQ